MEKVLEIENLKLSFNGPLGKVDAVKGVSLSVEPGEILVLAGESGCGKTSLCRTVMGLHAGHAVIEDGRITLCGRNIERLGDRKMEDVRGKDSAMIFQEPRTFLNPVFSVGDQIAQAVQVHCKCGKREALNKAVELLEAVGISNAAERAKQYPHHFSGGMAQRVAIALALAGNPSLIIADEPTTALDCDTEKKIMELLINLCRESGKAMIFVTHDISLAEKTGDRIAVMKDGVIVEEGTVEEVFTKPQNPYTRSLLKYAHYGREDTHRHGKVIHTHTTHSHGRKEDNNSLASRENTSEQLLHVDHIYKTYGGNKRNPTTVFSDYSMEIRMGEIVGLAGPSGSGKSTLARCIMGIEKPDKGAIYIKEGCKKRMVFQDSASAFNPRMSVEEIIAEPLVITGHMKKDEIRDRVKSSMQQVGLSWQLAGRHPYDLSGGERQRTGIARALITDPDFLIADEPISSLDIPMQGEMLHLLWELHNKRNLTIMIISHNIPMLTHVCDRVIQIKNI